MALAFNGQVITVIPQHPQATALSAPSRMRFSYSTMDQPWLQRAIIQAVEILGGRHKLKRLYSEHMANLANGEGLF